MIKDGPCKPENEPENKGSTSYDDDKEWGVKILMMTEDLNNDNACD